MRQMKAKIALVLSLAIILFVVYLMYFKGGEAFAVQEPGAVEDIVQPTQPLPERTVSPGGPNSPALRAPPEEGDTPVVLPGPEHRDPYAQSQQVSNFGDDARSPERMFGPAPLPTITDIGTASGAMSRILSDAPATQQFATEAAQNGGEFIPGGVFANDTDVPKNFSMY